MDRVSIGNIGLAPIYKDGNFKVTCHLSNKNDFIPIMYNILFKRKK
jgi:hypothetical protein